MASSHQNLPNLLSSFVDTFVDFSISSGLFLPPRPPQSERPLNPKPDRHANSKLDSNGLPRLRTVFSAPGRLIAVGDLHGDLNKTKQAFRLSGLIDEQDRWCGGSTTAVQVGDVLDRGGEELKILYFLEKLRREAGKAGGCVITLNGNHEIMNVDGDFRSVSREGLKEFEDWAFWYRIGQVLKKRCGNGIEDKKNIKDPFDGVPSKFAGVKPEWCKGIRARIAALRPNGPVARRFLSQNHTVVVVGDSVLVHGGLLPKHVDFGLVKANKEVRDWICGVRKNVRKKLNSIVWSRKFSKELAKDCDCSTLKRVLAQIPGAKRMIVGHTIQRSGINSVCDNMAIRIDVGMSRGYIDSLPDVLEIDSESRIRVLTLNPLYNHGFIHKNRIDGVCKDSDELKSRTMDGNGTEQDMEYTPCSGPLNLTPVPVPTFTRERKSFTRKIFHLYSFSDE
ncbi:shewanella-like protein phosphatase 2 [Ipomoea triloba]|uniref:shewanella-like protein phosphatase 2 n=1 Tax=Ipomoea triloba TaxID=35885 RepID=UPI00125D4D8C|nr:shewanella-like protein phosphatase 2 [Ipomoea triloba]